jgi:diadenosine tetraphosphate (Ap4A) HIT family hydrolase
VCNQGFAQAVHHVHFHIVPAPLLGDPDAPRPLKRIPSGESIFLKERENRGDLDDEEAKIIRDKIRSKL